MLCLQQEGSSAGILYEAPFTCLLLARRHQTSKQKRFFLKYSSYIKKNLSVEATPQTITCCAWGGESNEFNLGRQNLLAFKQYQGGEKEQSKLQTGSTCFLQTGSLRTQSLPSFYSFHS